MIKFERISKQAKLSPSSQIAPVLKKNGNFNFRIQSSNFIFTILCLLLVLFSHQHMLTNHVRFYKSLRDKQVSNSCCKKKICWCIGFVWASIVHAFDCILWTLICEGQQFSWRLKLIDNKQELFKWLIHAIN